VNFGGAKRKMLTKQWPADDDEFRIHIFGKPV
jgi:hypothetical protein